MRDKLTDTAIRNTKPRPKEFKLSDGGGLHLFIRPNGSKLWRFRYRYDGKESMIGLGSYELARLITFRSLWRESVALMRAAF